MCAKETADFDFSMGGDDGYRVFINDQAVIDDWTPGAFRSSNITKTLEAGVKYRIRIEYYQKGVLPVSTLSGRTKTKIKTNSQLI